MPTFLHRRARARTRATFAVKPTTMLETPPQPRRCQRFCTKGPRSFNTHMCTTLLEASRQPRSNQRFGTDGAAPAQEPQLPVNPQLCPILHASRDHANGTDGARPCSFRSHGSASCACCQTTLVSCEGDEPCRRHNWSSQFCGIARCQSGGKSSSTSLLCKDRSLSSSSVSTSTDPSAPASPRLNGARTFTLPVQGFVRIGALGFGKGQDQVKREVLSCETEEHFVSLNRTADD